MIQSRIGAAVIREQVMRAAAVRRRGARISAVLEQKDGGLEIARRRGEQQRRDSRRSGSVGVGLVLLEQQLENLGLPEARRQMHRKQSRRHGHLENGLRALLLD